MKFSLVGDGTLDKPHCARLLLVNGVGDECVICEIPQGSIC